MANAEGSGARARKKRARRQMTAKRLRNIAVYYSGRYLVSEAKLQGYLEIRLAREVEAAEERDLLAEHIPGITASLARIGLVDDRQAAASRLRTALRAGYAKSTAVNVAARASRVDREVVTRELPRALEETVPEAADLTDDPGEEGVVLAEHALRRARRGPYRTGGRDETRQTRDVNWLRRRGFRYDEIRKAMRLD